MLTSLAEFKTSTTTPITAVQAAINPRVLFLFMFRIIPTPSDATLPIAPAAGLRYVHLKKVCTRVSTPARRRVSEDQSGYF
jgi:hypothetical protein